jgi:predicted nuclease of predicted toxin-antitoxin system
MAWKKIELSPERWQQWQSELSGERGRTRFLIDENVPQDVPSVLRRRKYSVMTVADYGYADRSDREIYALATSENRVLVTHDQDFFDDERFPIAGSPGVAVLPRHADGQERFIRAFGDLLKVHGDSHQLWRERKAWIRGDGTVFVRFCDPANGDSAVVALLLPENGPPMIWED